TSIKTSRPIGVAISTLSSSNPAPRALTTSAFISGLKPSRGGHNCCRAAGACEAFQERQIYDEVCTSRSIRPLNYAKQTQFPAAKLECLVRLLAFSDHIALWPSLSQANPPPG